MTWVIFDYGNVISSPQPRADLSAMATVARSQVRRFWDAYWLRRHDYDLADLTAESYWQTVAAQLERSWDGSRTAELVRLDLASWSHVRPDTVRLIEEVAAAGHRLAMLSNAPYEIADGVAALPVVDRFEHLLFSCHLRAAKPDPRIFQVTLTRLGAEPRNAIFIDDRPENVAAAARVGIHAIHFTSPEAARAQLKEAGAIIQARS